MPVEQSSSTKVFQKEIEQYKPYFKHLRVMGGIVNLSGQYVVEALTLDGRLLSNIVRGREEVFNLIKQWLPK